MTDRPLRVNNKLWLISDTHFGHDNIVRFQQRPTNHEVIMASEWIRRVREEDQILHLGDVAFGRGGRIPRWLDVIGRLPGQKFLILGNHDDPSKYDYAKAGFDIVPEFIHEGVAFSHRPVARRMVFDDLHRRPFDAEESPLLDADWLVNIHGHTHSNNWNPDHDGTPLGDRAYLNVCVEHTGLAPVRLGNVYPI